MMSLFGCTTPFTSGPFKPVHVPTGGVTATFILWEDFIMWSQRCCPGDQSWVLVWNQGHLNFRYKEERSDWPPKNSVFTDWHVLFNVEIPREPQFGQLLFPTAQLCSFLLPWGLKWLQMKWGVRVLVGVELLYISHCPNPLTLTPTVFPTPPSRRVCRWKGRFDSQSPFHTTPPSILKESVGPVLPRLVNLVFNIGFQNFFTTIHEKKYT